MLSREGIECLVPPLMDRGGNSIYERAARKEEADTTELRSKIRRGEIERSGKFLKGIAFYKIGAQEIHGRVRSCWIITITAGS